MLASDVILQLAGKLPQLVDDFTDSFSVVSLSRIGTTVTVVTSASHGLTIDKVANIVGAKTPIVISSINRVGTIATMVTATNHDITEGDQFPNVETEGAVESEFNGTFKLLKVLNRKTIAFQVADSGPLTATGSPLLVNGSNIFQSYNGLQKVTAIPTTTSFEYEITNTTLFTPASGVITAKTAPRISGAVTLERAKESYSKQLPGKAWLYVVLNNSVANRTSESDANVTSDIKRSQNLRQIVIQSVDLFVFLPATDGIAGRQPRDRAEELFLPILQSVFFKKFNSLTSCNETSPFAFVEHGFEDYDTAVYTHSYTFEINITLGFDDSVGPDNNVAFRDIDMSQFHDIGTGVITTQIDLDEVPL